MAASACETTSKTSGGATVQASGQEERVFKSFYLPFWGQSDHLERIMREGGVRRAAKLYIEQSEYFSDPKNRAKSRVSLDQLAEGLNNLSVPALAVAIERLEGTVWPAPPSQWIFIRETIVEAQNARDTYPKEGLLADFEYLSPVTGELDKTISELMRRIKEGAATEYAWSSPSVFFS
jgi:hypothetical protein